MQETRVEKDSLERGAQKDGPKHSTRTSPNPPLVQSLQGGCSGDVHRRFGLLGVVGEIDRAGFPFPRFFFACRRCLLESLRLQKPSSGL